MDTYAVFRARFPWGCLSRVVCRARWDLGSSEPNFLFPQKFLSSMCAGYHILLPPFHFLVKYTCRLLKLQEPSRLHAFRKPPSNFPPRATPYTAAEMRVQLDHSLAFSTCTPPLARHHQLRLSVSPYSTPPVHTHLHELVTSISPSYLRQLGCWRRGPCCEANFALICGISCTIEWRNDFVAAFLHTFTWT